MPYSKGNALGRSFKDTFNKIAFKKIHHKSATVLCKATCQSLKYCSKLFSHMFHIITSLCSEADGLCTIVKGLAVIAHLIKEVLLCKCKVWINNMVEQIACVVISYMSLYLYVNELK